MGSRYDEYQWGRRRAEADLESMPDPDAPPEEPPSVYTFLRDSRFMAPEEIVREVQTWAKEHYDGSHPAAGAILDEVAAQINQDATRFARLPLDEQVAAWEHMLRRRHRAVTGRDLEVAGRVEEPERRTDRQENAAASGLAPGDLSGTFEGRAAADRGRISRMSDAEYRAYVEDLKAEYRKERQGR